MDWRPVLAQLLAHAERMRPMMRDVSVLLTQAMAGGQSVLFEGAQGTLLDIDHGTYPYVNLVERIGRRCLHRPRHSTARHRTRARRGQGLHHPRRRRTAADRADRRDGQPLRDSGNEYGRGQAGRGAAAGTDAVAVRYGVRINGLDAGAHQARRARRASSRSTSARRTRSAQTLTDFQATWDSCRRGQPVYESNARWTAPTAGVRTFTQLPEAARKYIARLERGDRRPRRDRLTGSERDRHDHPRGLS